MTGSNARRTRRRVIRALGVTGASAAVAGCTDVIAGRAGSDDAVLDPPENYERTGDLDLPYPQYGEPLPAATISAPLHQRTVSTREFVGERHVVMTFIFTSCATVCPGLTTALGRIQADAAEQGYADRIALLPVTFDPAFDTADVLRAYGENVGVDPDADNWYFLRPETPERAREVVDERFGVAFEARHGDHDDDPTESGTADGTEQGGGDDGHGHAHERNFVHSSLILLANADGYVERAYFGGRPLPSTIRDDVRTVVEGW